MKWKNFDHWSAKAFAWLLVVGSGCWMFYAIWWHYDREHACKCLERWEYLPFVVGLLVIIFALAILSSALTAKAAEVVLPFASLVLERMGRRSTDTFAVVPSPPSPVPYVPPPQPSAAHEDRGDK